MQSFVERIVFDKWNDALCDEEEILTPTILEVDQIIEALDAKIKTLVSMYCQDGSYLTIGGGTGQYVVYTSTSDGQLWNLLGDSDNRDEKEIVLLVAGGQEGDFPVSLIVNKAQVLQAAHTFFITGQMDTSLVWEKQ